MKNYYFLLKGLLCFLFLGLFSSALHAQEKIIQVGAGEYLTTYRTNLGNLYVTRWGGGARPILHNYGLTNVIDVDGAQYSNVCLTAAGNVYVVGVTVSGSPYTTLVPTDNLGNPFKNNSKVYGFYQSYLTLRNGTVWYWGTDDVLNMNNGSAVPAPIQLIQPAGKTMVKLVPASSTTFAGSATLWGLASDGTVWQWNRNSRSPSQVNFPGNIARDITMIGPMSYVIETATDLLAWGYDPSYAGGRPAWQQPGIQSVKAAWVNAGCVFPLKEFVGNYNTLHVIDANDNMFASGANPQGNIGNGIQTNPWKNVTLPWNWDWYNGQLMTPPTQVPGKFKNICTSNTITFYLYVQDMGDDWYSWGRNKALCLGNGKTLSVDDMAIYPEALNVPAPTLVTPLSQAWTVLPFNPNGQQPPLSHAGVNQYISSNTTTLYGSGSSQQDGSIVNFSWVKTSGPAATIVSPNAMNTQVTGLTSGTYIFSLTITNNYGVQHTSTVKVVVGSGAPANQPPVANAGNNQTITLPTNSVLLSGSGSDGDGTISMIQWSKISGPAQGNFASANSFSTRVNNLVQGVYSLQLEVTDNNGAKGRDTVVVTVLPAPNQAPVVITSSDISITLPVNEAPLEATITDADGSIVSILWTLVSGGAAVIDDPNAESTTVSGLEPGLYTFALTATDDDGATGSDTLLILVNTPVNQAPMAIAGPNQAVTSAVGSVTLNGDGYDPDGMISSMQWRKVQGGAATIQNPASGVTNVSNLAVDVYKFELTVTDDMGASARDTMQLTVTQAPNQPPVANAGPDISITLPINYVSITGNGTDPDGTITSYLWSKLSGPSATISNAFSPTVNITNMVQGLYVFRLRVTDNDGVSSTDNVVIVVEPAPNQMPVAHAGTDITITLPTNSVTLNGAGTDSDGTIVSYSWENISGPSAPSIASSNSASTVVNNLVEGHYIFKLTITDDRGGTATDEVDVIVLRAPNQAPTANAGPDQIITLPINYTALNGIGTDVDGSIVSYRWSKVSGPFATIANVASRNTNVSGLLEGTYVFQLKVTDNEGAIGTDQVTVVVQPQPNQAPVVSSGNDITITLPVNYVNLSATASDPDGVINSYQWTKISGGAASIVSPLSAATRINGLAQGSYTFRIRVIDNLGDEAYDDIDVTVLPQPNQAPTANAGSDITITLPQNATTLNGSGSDVDGTISSYGWAQLSGPSTVTIISASTASTDISGLTTGVYIFELTVTDNSGSTARDQVSVTVLPQPNQAPTANAGSDITITLPQNATTLNGGGSDGDGYIIGYHWEQVSGPSIAYITSANGSVTSVTGLITGMYIFKLTVTDNSGSTGADQVSVTVLPQPNQAPTANAGSDITITLPQNATTLNGSGSDVDGTVVSYQWEQISGPNSATITNANAAVANVSGLVQGSYVFRITVTDNEGATGNDAVNVQVLTAANLPPVANAGSDITITLPVNTVTLSGSGTDPDNYVVAYRWVKVSGGVANITNSNLAQTTVNGLEAGIYTFELTVTDNSGATGSDQVVVTVLPAANISPMVNAGNDQTITLPVNWVVLNGSAIDGDGTIVAYEWIKVSGGDANIQSPSSSVSQVTNLEEGLYTFRLVVTDNDGASASGEMHVLVLAQPFNNPPIANAGLDQTINLPQNQILLDGGGTDSDGQVVAYEWLKITGPAGGFVTNGNNASTTVTGLQLGVYKFQLIVVDNEGAIGRDTVVITVLPASGNLAPTANAGPDLTVLLPISSVELHGEGSDLDGDVVRYRWNVLSGPNRPALRGSNDSRLYMSYLRQGVYTIEFIVWDNEGAEGRDTMLLYVNQNQVTNDLPDDFIRTFPNPVVNRLTIHFRTYHQNRSIRCVVVDLMGMPVSERIVILSNFVNIFQMNLSHLHTGFYRLNIYSDGYPTVSMPIIKQ